MTFSLWVFVALAASARAYWLMGIEDFITSERIDPVVSPGKISGHVHSVLGGSNFRFNTSTDALRQSESVSQLIPMLVRKLKVAIDYLFSDTPGTTTAFPDNFRMLSGDPTLRTYDANSYAQQAVTFFVSRL
ncbi:hypothetical protein NP233_g12807 [Leucocoprinus birnbaumii]|uniref:DUF1996 domain-containing protein n=1 Tax=Leucocoprinus birnbaumii TaxID=56174 RepID=A0AAD5YPM8_9AGAR|nr:hypothetical protein NP233_g12807 [Leucocoprinus birnbaumii]